MPSPVRLRSLYTLTVCALLVGMAGCGGGGGGGGNDGDALASCGESSRKQFVLDVAREWYLFDDLLPASVNTADFADAETLLDYLTATARDQGKDRYFSYLTTRAAEQSLLGEGQFVGFGFRTRTDPVNRPMILEVFEASPASEASMQRGDEIVAVDSGSGYVDVSVLLADGSTISDVLGPADIGVRRGLRLLRNGVTREVTLVKRTVTIDPVSDVYGVRVLPLAGTSGVGYLNLRTYITTADPQLRAAFDQFRLLNLDYFIVDLRYNGGGLVSISELINNLLGAARSRSDVQFRTVHNTRKSGENSTTRFNPTSQSVQPVRIAFLTTGGTASASEMNINSMLPWVEIAMFGDDTLGKPVGQYAFDLPGCEDRLRLVTFKTVNALGQGDYYDGLAALVPNACAATDTLDQPLGSTSEGMVSAALSWLGGSSACEPMAAGLARAKTSAAEFAQRYPRPRHPSAAQWWLPGLE
jgi:C-terminal processing protease CtpA/Prc